MNPSLPSGIGPPYPYPMAGLLDSFGMGKTTSSYQESKHIPHSRDEKYKKNFRRESVLKS